MSADRDSPDGEEYGDAEINHRGRLTILKELRDELNLDAGTTFTVVKEGTDIRLVRDLSELETLTSGNSRDEWGRTRFPTRVKRRSEDDRTRSGHPV